MNVHLNNLKPKWQLKMLFPRLELASVRTGSLSAHHHSAAAGPEGQPWDDHRCKNVHASKWIGNICDLNNSNDCLSVKNCWYLIY